MTAVPKNDSWVSPQEYLEGELLSPIRHEYLQGVVHAMAGASRIHNLIAGNLFLALGNHLRGKSCVPFGSDMKVLVPSPGGDTYYYPDTSVSCDPTDTQPYYLERPVALFEVVSPATDATDRREKMLAYRALPSVETYAILEQDFAGATVHHREKAGWRIETLTGSEAVLRVPALDFETVLRPLYERTGLV